MRRSTLAGIRLITYAVVTLAMIASTATRASAQNPFAIDGNVTDLNNSGLAGAAKINDPTGSAKELGPLNGSSTKVAVIHRASTPMLALTNPNPQVDLTTIYTQTARALNGHLWYYFGWVRDSNSGSGFISIEFQHAALSAACSNYANANCNPWSGRSATDFLLLWDQSGGSTEILKRVFSGTGPNLTLGAAAPLGSAVAQFSGDGFRGELAIDLSMDVFPTDGTCTNFANIIPGTVTGNSDTADYKDAVLSAFPDVSNCGGVKIIKKTVPASLSGTFVYTLAAGGAPIFPTNAQSVVQKDADCTNSSATNTTCEATLTAHDDFDEITGLLEVDTQYTLEEDPGTGFTLTSITCTLGGVTYPSTAFRVEAGQTTECTITNTLLKGTPDQNTTQTGQAQIFDQLNLSNIRAGASDANSATAVFRLYSDSACTVQVGADITRSLSGQYNVDSGTNLATAVVNTLSPTPSPRSISPGTVYYWKVTYSGDALNNGFTTACGQETAAVAFTFVQ